MIFPFLMISLACFYSGVQPRVITRQSYGVIFNRINKPLLQGYADYKVSFRLDIPWAKHVAPDLKYKLKDYMQDTAWPRLTALFQEIDLLDSELLALMPKPRMYKPRPRKGLLNIVGRLSSFLFGTASSADVHKIWGAINNLRRYALNSNDYKISTAKYLWHQSNLTNSRFNNIHEEMNKISSFIRKVTRSVNETIIDMQKNHAGLTALSSAVQKHTEVIGNITRYFQSITLLQDIVNKQKQFIHGLQQLQGRVISPDMILPREMHKALYEVRQRLTVDHPLYKVVHEDVLYYYYNALHNVLYTKEALYLTITVPVASLESIYTVWETTVLNVPLNTKSAKNYDGYTRLEQIPEYLAVSTSGLNFIEIFNDLSGCKLSDDFVCSQPQLINTAKVPTCAIALYLNNDNAIKSVCSPIYSTSNLTETRVIKIARAQYLISTMCTEYEAICPHRKVIKDKLCSFCLIKPHCGCTINIGEKNLRIPFSDCLQTDTVEILSKHTFNGGLAHAFDLTSSHNNSLGWFDRPVKVQLPSLRNFTKSIAALARKDNNAQLKLHELSVEYYKAKESKSTLVWVSNPPATEDIVVYVLTGVTTLLSAASMAAVIIGARKLKTITAVVAALKCVEAAPLKDVLLQKYSTVVPLVAPPLADEATEDNMSQQTIIMGCFIMIGVFLSVYITRACCIGLRNYIGTGYIQNGYEAILGPPQTTVITVIYIVFDAPKIRQHIVCTLTTLTVSPNMLQFASAPGLRAMTWLNASTVKLHWHGEPRLSINLAVVDSELPQLLHVPWALRTKLRQLYDSTELSTRLLLKYDNLESYVQIPTSRPCPLTYTVPVQAKTDGPYGPVGSPLEPPPKPARMYPAMGLGPLNIEVQEREVIEMTTFKAPSAPSGADDRLHVDTPAPARKLPRSYWSPYSDDGDDDI